MHHDHHATHHYDSFEGSSFVPGRFVLDIFQRSPAKVLALFHEQYSIEFRRDKKVDSEYDEFEWPEIEFVELAGPVEDEHRERSYKFAENIIGVDVDVEFHSPFAEIVEEKGHDKQVVHDNYKCMDVLVVDDDPHQEQGQVANAEVHHIANAVDDGWEMEGVFELEVAVGEVEFVEQKEEDAVGQHAGLVVVGVYHRPEQVEFVGEEGPLEHDHLENVGRFESGPVAHYC